MLTNRHTSIHYAEKLADENNSSVGAVGSGWGMSKLSRRFTGLPSHRASPYYDTRRAHREDLFSSATATVI